MTTILITNAVSSALAAAGLGTLLVRRRRRARRRLLFLPGPASRVNR